MKRIPWIEVLKGLGILMVVAGHIYQGEISRNIYIFHMPLFFFISGYLFRPSVEFKKYFIKKVFHLLIPYFCFLIPLYIFFTELPSLEIEEVVAYFLRPIIGGKLLGGPLTVFWFITCLFLTQQLMNYLINKLNSKRLLLLMMVMLMISYCNTYFFSSIWLPLGANVILASAPIFYTGYVYRKESFEKSTVLLALLGIFVLLFSFVYPENGYDMKNAEYGIPILTFFSSLVLILNLKVISVKLSSCKVSYHILSEIGKASMVMMYLHQPIQMVTKSNISTDNTIRFLLSIIFSYVIYLLLSKVKVTRALFLGSSNEFNDIFRPLIKYIRVQKATIFK